MAIGINILKRSDEHVLTNVLPDVFDNRVDHTLTAEFLNDPRHHIAVALDGTVVVGFVSAVHYVHPDKLPELWINEVSVSSAYRHRGLAKQMMSALFDVGRKLGCREAWVLTDRTNTAAMKLYESLDGKGTDHVMFSFRLK